MLAWRNQVNFNLILHWISGCAQEACWVHYSLVHFRTNEWSLRLFLYYTGSVDAGRKHVKSALQAGSLLHRSMSGASGYFCTTLDQEACWVCTSYSLFHILTSEWSSAVGSVCEKHVEFAPQPPSLSHGAMSGASCYFYTTLGQWLYIICNGKHVVSALQPFSLSHQWVESSCG